MPWEHGQAVPQPVRALTNWTSYGQFAVAIFIVVSGFCLTLPVIRDGGLLRGGMSRFMRRRARRILPPFYFAALLSLVLIWTVIGSKTGTHWDVAVPVTAGGYIANALMLQNVVSEGQINHAFWSIAVEWQIYLLFPLMLIASRRFGVLRGAAATIAFAGAAFVVVHGLPSVGSFDPTGFVPELLAFFALGSLAARIAFSDQAVWQRARALPWTPLAACFVVVTVLGCLAGLAHGKKAVLLDIPVGLMAVSLLVAGARTEGRNVVRSVLGARRLAAVGVFSYSIYLIHAPLLQVEEQYMLRPLGVSTVTMYVLLILVGVPLIVGAAYLFFLLCERPFMSARQKRASEGEFVDKPAPEPEPAPTLVPEPAAAEAPAV